MAIEQPQREVIITGGTGSVGRELVETFILNGDHVAFQYNKNEDVALQLRDRFNAEPIQMDFLNTTVLPRQNFDIVINSAGINISACKSLEVTLPDWERTLFVNVTVPFLLVQQCLPHMIEKQWGRIINISSIYGLHGVETILPYTVSKHALSGLTKTLAREYGNHQITCNEICPGPIDSEMMRRVSLEGAQIDGTSVEEYMEEVCEEIPAGRIAKPSEISSLALFLASPEAEHLNGASIPLDGGLIA